MVSHNIAMASGKLALRITILLLAVNLLQGKGLTRDFKKKVDGVCDKIESCRCTKVQDINGTTAYTKAQCSKISAEDAQALTNLNTKSLELLQDEDNGTVTAVQVLNKFNSSVKYLRLEDSELKTFDFSWLPEHVEKLTFSGIGVENRSPLNRLKSTNCSYDKARLHKLHRLYLFLDGSPHLDIACLPDSLNTLVIWDARSIQHIDCPDSLRMLKTINIKDGYSKNLLEGVNSDLKVFWMQNMNVKTGVMPILRRYEKISNIYMQNCNISFIEEKTFLHHTNLSTVHLGDNFISNFNVKLPKTVKSLFMHGNSFVTLKSHKLEHSNLKNLYLQNNQLKACPTRLPKTLEILHLKSNNIETCLPDTFHGLTQLRALDLSNNKLTVMPTGLHKSLQIYRLSNNMLTNMRGPESYEFCSGCNIVDFSYNQWFCDTQFFKFLKWSTEFRKGVFLENPYFTGKCSNLPKYTFRSSYLKELTDYIDYISSPPFKNCRYEFQDILNCTGVGLTIFPKSPPRGLERIIISENRGLTVVPDFVSMNQVDLKSVTFTGNNLRRIPYGLPSSVELLDLQDNNITKLSDKDIKAFTNLTRLKDLILHDNHIKTVFGHDFKALKSLQWLGLEGNDLVCDCSLHSFILWYTDLVPILHNRYMLARYARCSQPVELRWRDIRQLYYYYNYELECVPPLCEWNETTQEPSLNCSYKSQMDKERLSLHGLSEPVLGKIPKIPSPVYWETIFLNGLQLHDDAVQLQNFTRLTYIDLSNNLLKKWSTSAYPHPLQELILSGNQIRTIPKLHEVLEYLPNLKRVDLTDNKISILLPAQVATLISLDSFQMRYNLLECNCALEPFILWAKSNATTSQGKNDAMNLECSGPADIFERKLVTLNDNEFCKQAVPVDSKIWTSAGLFIAIIALSMIMIIRVVKKKRYRDQILSGFQKLLQEEASHNHTVDDSEESGANCDDFHAYSFDAFVATEENEEDGEFVEMLIQELEVKRNFNLCISTRDFTPGTDIAESIVENIRESKRVILVLSKQSITSPWCQYKVQVALAELHQRQKKLLIPIQLEDLFKDSNPRSGIKTFISLIPTMKTPRRKSPQRDWEKFWNSISNAISN